MFTGIITNLGEVVNIKSDNNGLTLIFKANFKPNEIQLGDSIAINGACSTITKITNNNYTVDFSSETLKRTYFKELKINDKINLELSLTPASKMGGHFVTGHVDETGIIKELIFDHNFVKLKVTFSSKHEHLIIKKGSITIDGISLTIAQVNDTSFDCVMIPHTIENTILKIKKKGAKVNLEYDLTGKYITNYLSLKEKKNNIPVPNDDKLLKTLKDSGFL
ncbi:MAG: riboflavin synthase [Candidatus Margulisiibacteriota bacterium]|jgi:riboflavin synthase